jgi:hypothetical protein
MENREVIKFKKGEFSRMKLDGYSYTVVMMEPW